MKSFRVFGLVYGIVWHVHGFQPDPPSVPVPPAIQDHDDPHSNMQTGAPPAIPGIDPTSDPTSFSAFKPSGNISRTLSRPSVGIISLTNTQPAVPVTPIDLSTITAPGDGPTSALSSPESTEASETSWIQTITLGTPAPSLHPGLPLPTHSGTVYPIPATTMTSVPPDFSIQILTRPEWTTNTWMTTTASDGGQTILPVLVGCPGCGGNGIVLWNLPLIPNVSFKLPNLPNLPNLPQFSLPCIRLPFIPVGNCPGPVTENTDPLNDGNDGDDDNHSSAESTTTSTPSTTASSTESCTVTQTASNCVATCSHTTVNQVSTVTCFTTACLQTVTGCNVTGTTSTTTKQPCTTATTGSSPGRRDVDGDACPMMCPNWDFSETSESDGATF
ncbi:hypothetical protein CMUS01_14853, partial [Colletotrichum musicola]